MKFLATIVYIFFEEIFEVNELSIKWHLQDEYGRGSDRNMGV